MKAPEKSPQNEILFARDGAVQARLEQLLGEAAASVEAALYRLNNPLLARALQEAARRGVQVRLVVDGNKYAEDRATRQLLAELPFRVSYGRLGRGSKMHHKFAVFDARVAVAGSYNWTIESETENYESLLVLRAPDQIRQLRNEFEQLWKQSIDLRPPDTAR